MEKINGNHDNTWTQSIKADGNTSSIDPISLENLFKMRPRKEKNQTISKRWYYNYGRSGLKTFSPEGFVLKKYMVARVMPWNIALCKFNDILMHIETNVIDLSSVTTIMAKVIIAKIIMHQSRSKTMGYFFSWHLGEAAELALAWQGYTVSSRLTLKEIQLNRTITHFPIDVVDNYSRRICGEY